MTEQIICSYLASPLSAVFGEVPGSKGSLMALDELFVDTKQKKQIFSPGRCCDLGSPIRMEESLRISALQRYLPSNNEDSAAVVYSSDDFRMYEFKVRRCMRGRSHDWTECPFMHPGEKARRRDPRRFNYSGNPCPEFRKGSCRRGDACEFAHGVFECWLHPDRYRTQACKDGRNCTRRVCFFAHCQEQLRNIAAVCPATSSPKRKSLQVPALRNACNSTSFDGSPLRRAFESSFDQGYSLLTQSLLSSPTSTLIGHNSSPPSLSPPLSPPLSPETSVFSNYALNNNFNTNPHIQSPQVSQTSTNSVLKSSVIVQSHADSTDFASSMCPDYPGMLQLSQALRALELDNTPMSSPKPALWQHSSSQTNLRYPPPYSFASNLDNSAYGFCTNNTLDLLENEPVQRVESGKDLRAKIYARLASQNSRKDMMDSPDVGWVNELVE